MRHVSHFTFMSLALLLWACETPSGPLRMGPQVDTPVAKHNAEGVEAYNADDWGGAKKHFEAAITADPGYPEPHYNLGLVLDKLGSHSEATAHFKKAAELDPGNPAVTKSDAYERHVSPPAGFGGSGY